ncbi:MAG: MMPL family transporter [Tannerella sp.]|jgi:predicted exporter|nr:MMPL family transporter [Tannerella sp.]
MTNFFITVYHYFKVHKIALYLLMVVTIIFFVFTGLKLAYDEEFTALFPLSEAGTAKIAFSELKVKDRITVQIFSPAGNASANADPDILVEAADTFVRLMLENSNSSTQLTPDNFLYRLDDDVMQQAMSFVIENVAPMVDTAFYGSIMPSLTRDAIFAQMAHNKNVISSPEGMILARIMRYDPLGFRDKIMPQQNLLHSQTLYANHIFTPDTTVALIFITPEFLSFDLEEGAKLISLIERTSAEIKARYPDLEALFHGPPVRGVYNSRQIKRDLTTTIGISLILVCLLIAVCFRNKSTLPMLLLPVVYGTFFALSLIFLIKGSVSLMSLGIGAVVLGVSISYCLHLLTHFKYVNDAETVLKDETKPVILGSLTTVGAFAGLLFTRSALLSDFGLFALLSMVGTTLTCLVVLPQFFRYVKNRRNEKAFKILDRINAFPLERYKWIHIVTLIVFAASFYASFSVEFDPNIRNLGYYEPQMLRSMELYDTKTAHGATVNYYAVTGDTPEEALTLNSGVGKICDSLLTAGYINDFSNASMLLIPENEQLKRIEAWKTFFNDSRITELRNNLTDAARANGFKPEMFDPFFEMLSKNYQPVKIYEETFLPDNLTGTMFEKTDDKYLIYTAVIIDEENVTAVNDLLAAQPNVIVADPIYYATGIVRMLHDDFNTILGISSAFVFLTLLLAFRSLPLAVIAFLPMAMSWYIVLGMMSMLGLQLNLVNILISTFIFGIGVDYSIFVMQGLLADARGENNRLIVYHKTAILLSAIILLISISSLMFATHQALSSVGIATLIGMTSSILISYTLEPFLFNLWMKKRRRK